MKKMKMFLTLALAALLIFSSCSAPSESSAPADSTGESSAAAGESTVPTGEPAVGGTLNVGLAGDPYSLGSWVSNDLNSSLVTNLAFPRLMEVDADGNKVPYIVKDYEMNEDGTEFKVTIHEGLSWHDGTPFTVADLEFTAKYIVEKQLGYNADMYAPVDSMEIVDDYTIIYKLNKPTVNFLSQVGYWVQIMPKHIYETVEDPKTFDHPCIGYGPYKFVEAKKGEYYTFERVENWPLANEGKGAFIEKINFRIYPDANAIILAMKNGEIDVAASPLPVVAQKQLAEGGNFQVLSVPSLGFGYFGFNYKNANLVDVNLRKAIAMTIDRDAMIAIAMQGGAEKMESPISPVYSKVVDNTATFPTFDLEAAKSLMEESGYKDVNGDGVREDKDGKPMIFTLTHRNNTGNADAIASIFKDNCAQVGLAFEIVSLEPATYTDKVVKSKDFDVNFIDWGVIDDPDSSLATIYRSDAALNIMGYKNDRMDEILDLVEAEPDFEKRVALMSEFQKLFVEELPTVNTWVRTNAYGVSNKFAGWAVLPGLHGVMNTREIVGVYLAA